MLTHEQQRMFEDIVTTIQPEYKVCFDKGLIVYDNNEQEYIISDNYSPFIAVDVDCDTNGYVLLGDILKQVNVLLKCYLLAYNRGFYNGCHHGFISGIYYMRN